MPNGYFDSYEAGLNFDGTDYNAIQSLSANYNAETEEWGSIGTANINQCYKSLQEIEFSFGYYVNLLDSDPLNTPSITWGNLEPKVNSIIFTYGDGSNIASMEFKENYLTQISLSANVGELLRYDLSYSADYVISSTNQPKYVDNSKESQRFYIAKNINVINTAGYSGCMQSANISFSLNRKSLKAWGRTENWHDTTDFIFKPIEAPVVAEGNITLLYSDYKNYIESSGSFEDFDLTIEASDYLNQNTRNYKLESCKKVSISHSHSLDDKATIEVSFKGNVPKN